MNIYIVNELGSRFNGVGTYVRECINSFRNISFINLNVIQFNSENYELDIVVNDKIRYYYFPRFSDFSISPHSDIIVNLLVLYIKDSVNNVFLLNHGPCELFMRSIKNLFPLSKIIFVIHNFGWCEKLRGDCELFKKIFNNRRDNKIIANYKELLDNFDEEICMYGLTDRLICLSQDAYDLLIDVYKVNKDKIEIIPNGLSDCYITLTDQEKINIKKKLFIDTNEQIIIYSGRLNIIKGFDILLNALDNIISQGFNCRLIVAGAIFVPEWVFSYLKLNCNKVTFTGYLTSEELKIWYQIADLGVLPSFCEQCSYTGIEMMMNGLPIVASDGFGVKKYVSR